VKPPSRQMANDTLGHVMRVITKDAFVKPESIQVLIDLVRENSKVTRPVPVGEVVDSTFLEKAQRELRLR
jgi:hypothetical protein